MGNPLQTQFGQSGADPLQPLIQDIELLSEKGGPFDTLPYYLRGRSILGADLDTGKQERVLEIMQWDREYPMGGVIGGLAFISDAEGRQKFYETSDMCWVGPDPYTHTFRRGSEVLNPSARILEIIQAHVTPEDLAYKEKSIADRQRDLEIMKRLQTEQRTNASFLDGGGFWDAYNV